MYERPADPDCDLCGGRGYEVDLDGDRKTCCCRGQRLPAPNKEKSKEAAAESAGEES